jgi:LmbE family N-acetylglucosaminyl deacetylase
MSTIRIIFQKFLRRHIGKSAFDRESPLNQTQSALVFSPHFDDETLGCGGTIIAKRSAGARVVIAFMTDGSTSHKQFLPAEELRRLRKNEGLNAAKALGVNSTDVVFLGYEESRLCEKESKATCKVKHLIEEYNPEEIFIPHTNEPDLWSGDHLATNRIVKSALRSLHKSKIVCEYPIWYWFHWPWVGMDIRDGRYFRIIGKNTLAFSLGIRSLNDFNYSVYVDEFLEQKRNALMQHRTQMTRFVEDERWITLSDIANGQFLSCFFTDFEYFYRYSFSL